MKGGGGAGEHKKIQSMCGPVNGVAAIGNCLRQMKEGHNSATNGETSHLT